MIKSNLETVEIEGDRAIIMAEFFGILRSLKKALGEENYNRVLNDVNKSEQLNHDIKALNPTQKEHVHEILEIILKGMENR